MDATTGMYIPKKNRIKHTSNWWIHLLMIIGVCLCLLPFLLVLIISISDEKTVLINGYQFFPKKFSLAAYRYLYLDKANIIRAYGITIVVTAVGTLVSLVICSMVSYVMSRKDYPLRNVLAFFIFFTMLFNGGLVPWYLVYTSIFHFKDTLLALIIPNLLLNGFDVLVMRTFFINSISPSLIESAYLDGAGEFRIYWQIIIPLSLPVLAAIGFIVMLTYWNDWYNSLIFIDKASLVNIQYLMTKVLLDLQFLQSSDNTSAIDTVVASIPSETVRMAMAVVGVGPMLFAYPFFQKYFVKGLTIGAVKG